MRSEPLTKEEWDRLRHAPATMKWKQGEPVPRDYSTIIEALYALGCHPSVLARKDGLRFTEREGVWLAEWRRPKTKKLCVMNVPDDLIGPLRDYMTKPYSRQHVWRVVAQAGAHGHVEGVGPRVLRHTKAISVFKEDGPGAARVALGVSDRVLADYTVREASALAVERGKKAQAAKSPVASQGGQIP